MLCIRNDSIEHAAQANSPPHPATVPNELIIKNLAVTDSTSERTMNVEDLLNSDHTGKLEDHSAPLPPAVVETMKIVFRETHGGEMTAEDREFLGIADK